MIALIDYGAGNLASVRKGFAAAGAEPAVVTAAGALDGASAIVVPGVGHFAATRVLEGWRGIIRARLAAGVPLLGICLGMQWLFEGSDEAADVPGLGLIPGVCTRIAADAPLKVPHVGWNTIRRTGTSRLLEGVADGSHVYFTHSYGAPVTPECIAQTEHGQSFAAVVGKGRAWGVQFHPEKSADAGLRILRNFLEGVGA